MFSNQENVIIAFLNHANANNLETLNLDILKEFNEEISPK